MTAGATKAKTWRRDAQRNRDRIVASARLLIAREGIDASVEEITRHAGVGMGTLYRHFATKEELVDAVLEDALSEFVALAEQALAEEDAWTGFRLFLERAVGLHAANRGLKDVVATREHGLKHARAMRARPAGPAQSSVFHNFARSGPTKEAHRRAMNRSGGLQRSVAGQGHARFCP